MRQGTLVGRRLLCESCMRRETLVDVVHFCGVDNSGCESMCMRETMLAFLQLFGHCEVRRLLRASCVPSVPWSR